jgi:hypothetical protein
VWCPSTNSRRREYAIELAGDAFRQDAFTPFIAVFTPSDIVA